MSDNPQWEIIQGDALKVLSGFAPGTFDAVITDPPYASGGRTQAEKNKSTAKKYSNMGDHAPPPFDGDAKDQRSWTRWAAEWLYDARKICKPGAPVCMFIDWRQLPAATDALQWAGWIWRGTAVWDKGNSRPQKGRFRQQAEYIVWGSNGDMPISRPVPCLPGVFKYGNPQNRIHLTEKPLQLMRDIVKITEPGGRILDPFAGSGTTVLAAVLEGYSATGIEVTDAYAALARGRIRQALEDDYQGRAFYSGAGDYPAGIQIPPLSSGPAGRGPFHRRKDPAHRVQREVRPLPLPAGHRPQAAGRHPR